MKRLAIVAAAAVLLAAGFTFSLTGAGSVPAFGAAGELQQVQASLAEAAAAATGEDAVAAARGIQTLRRAGYAGLDVLLAMDAKTPQLKYAMDNVAMQKDAGVSRLFWYTDFEAAKVEAGKTGKPILSLRMLGKLNEDLSCANSRFFRTTLYANKEISGYLREHFILHWESVRPVPVVTIDMGDGRKIVRTITGNSIHYVLDSRGRVVDGIPGLYGPKAFLEQVKAAEAEAVATSAMEDGAFVASAKGFHERQVGQIRTAWQNDLNRVAGGATLPISMVEARAQGAAAAQKAPAAIAAAPRAVSKTSAEMPILRQLVADLPTLEQRTDDAVWAKIAGLHAEDAQLDAESLKLVRTKVAAVPAAEAAKVTRLKSMAENPVLKMVRNLQSSIAMDTVKNEYRLHPQIAAWLGEAKTPVNLKVLNERVYAELFLTPSSDPWLGLAPADVFSAIDDGGVCTTDVAAVSRQ